jgi:hypothetical protein
MSTDHVFDVVNEALRKILGRDPNPSDVTGFVEALAQSFTLTEQAGHTQWVWRPRRWAVQSDLGAGLTGTQADLYRRARTALASALPILDGLRPLSPRPDHQDLDTARATVAMTMTELVTELGQVGGPRVPRVHLLFELLMGEQPFTDASAAGGVLGSLRDRLGLDRGTVNTVEEEQELTNYRVLVDQVQGLRTAWEGARSTFDRRSRDFVRGSLLPTRLGAITDSVGRLRSALDVAGLRRAKRDEILIEVRDETSITLTELLDWVDSFASDEGPRLIQEGGRDGIRAIASIVARLQEISAPSTLRSLLEVVAAELAELEQALEDLYEEAMIETDGSSGSGDPDHPER